MTCIKILNDKVANQIAAGEVIERPVAVIKELIENSIDAKSTRIRIQVTNGGKSLIDVTDNGIGMTEDDALLCLERHATSKLKESNDLNKIRSFGFRGEALPSIASISKFTLQTRHADSISGTEVKVYAGKLLHKKVCGMPIGTRIRVENLFATVPARRKFLKTNSTESAHIHHAIKLTALAHPQIAFEFFDSGKKIIHSPKCLNINDRITELWNKNLTKDLLHIKEEKSSKTPFLSGSISKVGIDRSTRKDIHLFVNQRPVDSRLISLVIKDAYKGAIPKHRFPIAFLLLEIDPSEIDINIHPTKKEIRFRNESFIRQFILEKIANVINCSKQIYTAPNIGEKNIGISVGKHNNTIKSDKVIGYESLEKRNSSNYICINEQKNNIPSNKIKNKTLINWKFLHHLKRHTALYETNQGLIILNILKAKQRIRYESILQNKKPTEQISQSLIIPQQLEFEPIPSDTLLKNLELINQSGFNIESFGSNCFRVFSIPYWLELNKTESLIRDLIDQMSISASAPNLKHEIFKEYVAKCAIKDFYFDNTTDNSMTLKGLPEKLFSCKNPLTSPIGKKIFFEISWSDINKKIN